MSEPKTKARSVDIVAPGIFHWTVNDDRIQFRSDAHAVRIAGKTVMIDPLPLSEAARAKLGKIEAICITGSCHQRSAWHYRTQLGVKVYAPKGAVGLEETPDVWYTKGTRLPGGLKPVHAPGPTEVHYAFLLGRGRGALFCADILTNPDGNVRFVSDEYQDDPKRTRATAKKFLRLDFGILCFNHGAPLTKKPLDAIRNLLSAV